MVSRFRCVVTTVVIPLFAIGSFFLGVERTEAQTQSTKFFQIDRSLPFACALRASDSAVLPARILSPQRSRFVSNAWIRQELRTAQEKLRVSGKKRKKIPSTQLNNLKLREQILLGLTKRCLAMGSNACRNGEQDPFESGVDCGGICKRSCSFPVPSPTQTPLSQPAPEQTGVPTPGGVPTIGGTTEPTPVATTISTPTPVATATPTPVATATSTPTSQPTPYRPVPRPPLARNAECTDGIDNNGDGLTDFGNGDITMADFGCFGPNGQETLQDYGFTLSTASNDTRFIYVSSSTGDDSNSGLSALAPKRTLDAGHRLLRNGYPDWLLLKRGDTFDGTDWMQRLGRQLGSNTEGDYTWWRSGRSKSERMVLSSYGTSLQRPIIIATSAVTNSSAQRVGLEITGQRHVLVSGLDFYAAPCDPQSSRFSEIGCAVGIKIFANAQDIVIEDNRVRFFGSGINIQDSGPNPDQKWNDIVLRRNIIERNYNPFTHSQGVYAAGGGANSEFLRTSSTRMGGTTTCEWYWYRQHLIRPPGAQSQMEGSPSRWTEQRMD